MADLESEGLVYERASNRIAQMLQYPDQLDKVEQYLMRTSRKKAAVDARLKTAVSSQLDDVKHGLQLLHRAVKEVSHVRDNLNGIEEEHEVCQGFVEYVEKARALSDERTYLTSTMNQLSQIFNIPDTVEELQQALAEEEVEFLQIHHQISGLEKCRDNLLAQMVYNSGSQDPMTIEASRRPVEAYFEKVNVLSSQLQQKLLYEVMEKQDLLVCAVDRPATLVTAIRIIEREEKLDEKYEDDETRQPKRLKQRFFDKLESKIQMKFDNSLFQHQNCVSRFLNSFDHFYFDDLKIAKDVLPHRFPGHYDMFTFYYTSYHTKLCELLNTLQDHQDIDPSEIMRLLNWVPDYSNKMKSKIGIDVADLPVQLLNCQEDDLRTTYLKMMAPTLNTWSSNLCTTEAQAWFRMSDEDEELPNQNAEGHYFSDTPAILFRMVNEQVEVAFQPGASEAFAEQLIRLVIQMMRKFHTDYTEQLHRVRGLYLGPNPQERPGLLIEYLMVVVNNNYMARKNIKKLIDNLKDHFNPETTLFRDVDRELRNVNEGFHKIAEFAILTLNMFVMADIATVSGDLFTAKWLRSRKPIDTIIYTVKDYCGDFEEHLQPWYYDLLMQDLSVRLTAEYLRCFMLRRYVLKTEDDMQRLLERMEEEYGIIAEVFVEIEFEDDLSAPWDAISYVRQLLTSDLSMLYLVWRKIRSEFPDISLHHLEAILTNRLEFGTAKEVRSFIRDLVKKGGDDDVGQDGVLSYGHALFRTITVNTSSNFYKGDDKK